MGGIVLGVLVWQEGGESVGALLAVGAVGLCGLTYWLVTRNRRSKATLQDPDLFQSPRGLLLLIVGLVVLVPIVPRADSGWWLLLPLIISGCGLGLLVSQLNNSTLSPISNERSVRPSA